MTEDNAPQHPPQEDSQDENEDDEIYITPTRSVPASGTVKLKRHSSIQCTSKVPSKNTITKYFKVHMTKIFFPFLEVQYT